MADMTRGRHDALAELCGRSPPMQRLHALLVRAAPTQVTVLLEGETGTGKTAVARAIHQASGRRGPFVVVDCGAIPPGLIESELFGHERGAFTGADQRRTGAFEAASGGTLFLDEIGELSLEMQPKILRAIEERTVRRIGSNQHQPVDVRLVAATCRRLGDEARASRFRLDLFHRLAVAHLVVPPLRERIEDLPQIARNLLAKLGAPAARVDELLDDERLARLVAHGWPGNVRELRNTLERLLVFGELADGLASSTAAPDPTRPYAAARRHALDTFERGYVQSLLQLHDGNVAAAAASAGLHRVHLFRLIRRHGLRPRPPLAPSPAAPRSTLVAP